MTRRNKEGAEGKRRREAHELQEIQKIDDNLKKELTMKCRKQRKTKEVWRENINCRKREYRKCRMRYEGENMRIRRKMKEAEMRRSV